jgi:hypothetical protein
MRNLAQYPITTTEITETLDRIRIELDNENAIGDMRPLLLGMVAAFLRKQESNAQIQWRPFYWKALD